MGGGRRLGLVPRVCINDLVSLVDLAAAGAGIAAVPDYVAALHPASRALVRVLPRIALGEIAIHALYPSRRHLPRRVEVVLEALAGGLAG